MSASTYLATLSLVVLVGGPAHGQTASARPAPGSPTADQLPVYEIDPTWPPHPSERLDLGRHPWPVRR